jgi:hypothetical protein
MLIVNRNSANADGNFVSGFVMQESSRQSWTRSLDGDRKRAIFMAEFTARLVALQQRLSYARVADDFMARTSGDVFCSIAPENNFFLHVDQAEADRQAFQNAATDFGIVKREHSGPPEKFLARGFIGGIRRDFKGRSRWLFPKNLAKCLIGSKIRGMALLG